jgi:hypothetical protein
MAAVPFRNLTPARDCTHARWLVDAMQDREGVAKVVPAGYDAYLRIHHPLSDGRTWAQTAPAYLRRGTTRYEYPFPEPMTSVEGNLNADIVDGLTPVLAAATTTPESSHYGLWGGWGELHAQSNSAVYFRATTSRLGQAGKRRAIRRLRRREIRRAQPAYDFVDSCPTQPWWGGRDTLLFDGRVDHVRFIGSLSPLDDRLCRRSPQWWWPNDRAWFLANEIDYPWTYLGGGVDLIERARAVDGIEAVVVDIADEW